MRGGCVSARSCPWLAVVFTLQRPHVPSEPRRARLTGLHGDGLAVQGPHPASPRPTAPPSTSCSCPITLLDCPLPSLATTPTHQTTPQVGRHLPLVVHIQVQAEGRWAGQHWRRSQGGQRRRRGAQGVLLLALGMSQELQQVEGMEEFRSF